MRKSIAVFKYDRNPACDSPNFFITQYEADDRVSKHYATYIAPNVIQHHPLATWTHDERKLIVSGLMQEAWKVHWSGDFLVWQMGKTDNRPR